MAYAQYTLAQLRTQLANKWENKPFWVTAEADLAINEALETWNMLTGRWTRRVILTTGIAPSYAWDYALPAPMLYRTRITFNGRPMTPGGYDDLSLGRPQWMTERTDMGGDIPIFPTVWAPLSLQLIVIWPADAVGGNSLVADGIADTPRLLLPGDYVDLGEDDLDVLLGFALHVASFKKGGEWFAATLPSYQAFLAAAAAENQILATSQTYRRAMGQAMRDLSPMLSPSQEVSTQALVPGAGQGSR